MVKSFLIFLSSLILLAAAESAQSTPRTFAPGSLDAILKSRQGKPFVLMMWSVQCASCVKELDAVSASLKSRPDLDIVLVSTDEASENEASDAVLAKHGLAKLESWIFGDANAQKLRHEIDPAWFGELPRSFFYDPSHQRTPHTGVLAKEALEKWYDSVRQGKAHRTGSASD